jgi:hypothetical protein
MLRYIFLSCAFILFACKKEKNDNSDTPIVKLVTNVVYNSSTKQLDSISIEGNFNENNELVGVKFYNDTISKLEIVQNATNTQINFEEYSQGFLAKIIGQSEFNGNKLLKSKSTVYSLFEDPVENEKIFIYNNDQFDSVYFKTKLNTEKTIYNQFKYNNNRLEEFSFKAYDESTIPYARYIYKIEYYNETENPNLVNTSALNFNALLISGLFNINNIVGTTFLYFQQEIPAIKSNQLIKYIRVYNMFTSSYDDVYLFTYIKNEKGQVINMTRNFNTLDISYTLFEYL